MKKKLPAEKDALLNSGQSAGTKIKHHAQFIYFGHQYHKLDNAQKGSISNGLNSILDLTNHNSGSNDQRSLFTKEELLTLNNKWNKAKKWYSLEDDIQREMKEIEILARKDMRTAYTKTLSYQIKYALTDKEACFEVYASVLKILFKKKDILNLSKPQFTEADYVINVWSNIFQSVFEDSANDLFCKWLEY